MPTEQDRVLYRLDQVPPIPAEVRIKQIGGRLASSTFQGQIHNLSGSGCRFDLKVDLNVRELVIVQIEFTFGGRPFNLDAELRWKLDDRKLDRIHYGAMFSDVREFIQSQLVGTLHAQQIERRRSNSVLRR